MSEGARSGPVREEHVAAFERDGAVHQARVRDGDPLGDADGPRVWPLQRSREGA